MTYVRSQNERSEQKKWFWSSSRGIYLNEKCSCLKKNPHWISSTAVLTKLMRKVANLENRSKEITVQKRGTGIWKRGQNYLENGGWRGKSNDKRWNLQMNS